jgi:hypothetical protein
MTLHAVLAILLLACGAFAAFHTYLTWRTFNILLRLLTAPPPPSQVRRPSFMELEPISDGKTVGHADPRHYEGPNR